MATATAARTARRRSTRSDATATSPAARALRRAAETPPPTDGSRAGAPRAYVAVVGAGDADERQRADAEVVGRELARGGAVVVTGGLGGVMEAASRGAIEAGGTTLGLLPGSSRADGNAWLTVAVPTGMGELRNGLVVRAADALVAIGGGHGTLSEIALALKLGRPVMGVRTWDIGAPVASMHEPAAAAREALRFVAKSLQNRHISRAT